MRQAGRLPHPWAFSRVGTSSSRGGRTHLISEVNAVRLSRFSFPTFPQRTRKSGASVFLAGLRLSWLGVQDRAQNSHGQCWWCGQTRGPSTSYSGSLCEPEHCAQDDNVKEDTVRCEQLRLTHAWGFQGGRFNLEKRPASSYFRSECRGLVEILVSHLSAPDAERWGTRLLGEGEIGWAGVLGDAGSLDCARDDKVYWTMGHPFVWLGWETQGPSTALGMTDFLRDDRFFSGLHVGRGRPRHIVCLMAICFGVI